MAGCNWAPGPVAIAGQVKGARGSLPPPMVRHSGRMGADCWAPATRMTERGSTPHGGGAISLRAPSLAREGMPPPTFIAGPVSVGDRP